MQKRLAFFSIVLGVGSVIVSVAACTDDAKTSGFNDKPDSGSQDGSGPSFNTDAGLDNEDAPIGPVTCNPSLPTAFAPVWKAPTKAAACTTVEIGEYHDVCHTNQNNGADYSSAACTAWVAAHGTCATCLEPDDNSGPLQLYRERKVFTLNNGACVAIQQGELGADKCGAKYDGFQQCKRQSCDDCFSKPGATFENFQTCQRNAGTTGCVPYNTEKETACGPDYLDDADVASCFPTTAEANALAGASPDARRAAEKTFYTRVEGIFCGPT